MSETYIHADDDTILVAQDNDNTWVEVSGLPRPSTSMPVPKKGKLSLTRDGAVTLWLPSSVPIGLRSTACVDGLAAKEVILRVADCSDNLHNVRRSLRELSQLSSYRSKNLDGQHAQTRALVTLKALRDKRDRYVARYRRSRAAWLALDPKQAFEGGKWENVLRELKQTDLTFPGDDEEADADLDSENEPKDKAVGDTVRTPHGVGSNTKKRRQGKGRVPLTWIWRVQKEDRRDIPGLDSNSSEEDVYKRKVYYSLFSTSTNVHLDLRIEWAKVRSRAHRWEEEKRLLPEEMRRVVTAHIGTRNLWLSRVNTRSDLKMDISRGLDAYAYRQADIYWSMAISFVKLWAPELRKNGITVDWPSEVKELAATVDALPERKSSRKKAKATYTSESESEDDAVESAQFKGSYFESDTECLAGGEDLLESDGESILQHLASYTDSENEDGDAV